MIHHLSIPVTDTRHVAEVLAGLTDGVITEFGPCPGPIMIGSVFASSAERASAGSEHVRAP